MTSRWRRSSEARVLPIIRVLHNRDPDIVDANLKFSVCNRIPAAQLNLQFGVVVLHDVIRQHRRLPATGIAILERRERFAKDLGVAFQGQHNKGW